MTNPIKTIAVVGAGTMGQGIAQVFATGGYPVLLFDANSLAPEIARKKIEMGLNTMIEKGKLSHSRAKEIIKNIHPTENLDALKADLVVEAVVENLQVKQNLFQALEAINSDQTIFCSNTSSLSISDIFSTCQHPKHCLGVHFFNPAQKMKLVELVSGTNTDSLILNQVADFLKSLSKTVVVSKDSPGFIVNRVARHYYLESLKILEEGNTRLEDIDSLLRSAGFKMGPFELMDLIGIDVNLAVSTAVYNGFNQNPKYQPNPIQIQKVKDGMLGRKTGKGFYDYKL